MDRFDHVRPEAQTLLVNWDRRPAMSRVYGKSSTWVRGKSHSIIKSISLVLVTPLRRVYVPSPNACDCQAKNIVGSKAAAATVGTVL